MVGNVYGANNGITIAAIPIYLLEAIKVFFSIKGSLVSKLIIAIVTKVASYPTNGRKILAVAAALNSAVAAYYYFRIVRVMYLVPATSASAFEVAPTLRLALAILFTGTVLVGLFPQPIMAFVASVASSVV